MKFVRIIIQLQFWWQKNTLGWNVQFLTFANSKCVNALKYDFSHALKIPSHFVVRSIILYSSFRPLYVHLNRIKYFVTVPAST